MAPLPLLEELSKTAMSTLTKDQLLILIQREVKEDASKVSESKKLARELLEDVRRRRGYIGELKKLKTNKDAIGMVELLQRMQKDDREKAAHLLLMANKTKLKMQNKSSFILKLRGHLVSKRSIVGVDDVVDEDEYNKFDELPPFSIDVQFKNDVLSDTLYLRSDHQEGHED
ncbi:hypothetical protein Tco_1437775 [Tanacetum coccineum]